MSRRFGAMALAMVAVAMLLGGHAAALQGAGAQLPINPPQVLAMTPTLGPAAGGTRVTITGNAFTAAGSVTFDGTPGTNLAVQSDSQLMVTTPAHTAGIVNVVVNSFIGSSDALQFKFFAGTVPSVTGISPSTAPPGTTIAVTGSAFTGALSVGFGSVTGTAMRVNSDTSITVTAPAYGMGTVDVVVTTANGTSATSSADQFTYNSSAGTPVPTATPATVPGSTPTPSPAATQTPPPPASSQTFTLTPRWNLVVWAGQDGVSVATALSGGPAGGGVATRVTAVFRWDSARQAWQAYFPGSAGVPGANDFSTFSRNVAYWIAINDQGPATWTP